MNTLATQFIRWSPAHCVPLIICALFCAFIVYAGKNWTEERRFRAARILAAFMAINLVIEYILRFSLDCYGDWKFNLPLQFCCLMGAMSIIALWTRKPWACGMAYFGIFSASIQAFITPALSEGVASLTYWLFFVSHGCLLLAGFAIPFLLGWRTKKWDDLKSLLRLDLYLIFIIPVNILLSTNYAFTQHGPAEGSIADYLGPAPWYFLCLQIPSWGLFYVLSRFVREPKLRL